MRTSVLPSGVMLEGEIAGAGDLVVRGELRGRIDLEGTLTVDAGGRVIGEVRARAMVVRGTIEGPVQVVELLRLEAGAKVVGDVQADRVSAATGAVMRGRVRMLGATASLRRTSGGTLTAPLTSSGQIEAPRAHEAARVYEPIEAERLEQLSEPAPAASIRERTTEVPGERSHRRDSLRERATDTAQMRSLAAQIADARGASGAPLSLPAQSVPPAIDTTPAPAPSVVPERSPDPAPASSGSARGSGAAPPPPVVPRLGRVRSRRQKDPE